MMLPKKQRDTFAEFCDAAYDGTILDPKTTVMLKLATAMVTGCYP